LRRLARETRDEGEIIGHALLLQIIEYREFRRFARQEAPTKMIELIVQEMKVGAAQENIADTFRVPITLDL
jgi:hypothetical protein